MTFNRPGIRHGPRIGLVLLTTGLLAAPLFAQQFVTAPPDSAVTTVRRLDGAFIGDLPADSLEDAFLLLPGITGSPAGELSFRGGAPGGARVYVDGIPVSPGFRRAPAGGGLAETVRPALGIGTNAIDHADIVLGPIGADYGNARDGVVLLHTLRAPDRWTAGLSYQTGEVFGAAHDPGSNRLQGTVGGRLGGGFQLSLAGVLQGQRSPDSGPGSNQVPIFIQAGIDTTVAVPSAILDPLADTTYVPIAKFAVYRGDCGMFAGSSNADIAANAGRSCHGIRLPEAQRTDYQTLGKLDYQIGAGSRLSLLALASQHQAREFDYDLLYNPVAWAGTREWSRMLGLVYDGAGRLGSHPAAFHAFASWQTDRALSGPLGTRPTPVQGWMVGGLDFRWHFSNFALNDQLITNIRENIPNSRRSPYDLENRDQYSYIDQYRNDAYGLTGFVESGGPQGRLTMLRENRTLVGGSAALGLSDALTLRAGGEYTGSSIDNYSHALVSQTFAEAWLENPNQAALWVAPRLHTAGITLDLGLRYDRFNSGAARPYMLDTVGTSPGFGTYSYFPRPNSYGTGGATLGGKPLVLYVPDQAHSALSPRLRLAAMIPGAIHLHAGYARQTQIPRFQDLYSGLNTDLSITSVLHPYGTDLGFERQDVMEFGAAHRLVSGLTLDATVYHKSLDRVVTAALLPLADPQRLGASVDLRQFVLLDGGSVTGADLALRGRTGHLHGMIGYSYADAKTANDTPSGASRPNSVAGALALTLPADWHAGSLPGALLGHTDMTAAFRYASGAYNGGLVGSRLPSFSRVDLRLVRGFTVAGHTLSAFLDVRNLLNHVNTLAVFATTGTTTSAEALDLAWQVDSSNFANEGKANGVYDVATGEINLTFGGAAASGCGNWVNAQNEPAAPNCVYLIRAEERFGNGDGILSPGEQQRASDALARVGLGSYNLEGPPRRLRLGLQVGL